MASAPLTYAPCFVGGAIASADSRRDAGKGAANARQGLPWGGYTYLFLAP